MPLTTMMTRPQFRTWMLIRRLYRREAWMFISHEAAFRAGRQTPYGFFGVYLPLVGDGLNYVLVMEDGRIY